MKKKQTKRNPNQISLTMSKENEVKTMDNKTTMHQKQQYKQRYSIQLP